MRTKGFTLVEIVVAIGVLGVLSMGTLTVLSNNFNFLNTSRDITGETFLSQQEVELDISSLKNQMKVASHGLDIDNITIDGVSIGYHEVVKDYNGTTFRYRVTPQQLPEYVLLKTFDVKATLKSEGVTSFSAYPITGSTIMGSNNPDPATLSTHHMMDIHQWYESSPGFNVPVPKGPVNDPSFKYYDYIVSNGLDSELGTRYPTFPDDYILIGSATTNTINDVTAYAGRHIIYKVTPAAKSGRIGLPEFSDPIYINKLANTTNLMVHLDASIVDPSFKDASNNAHVDSNNKVVIWSDLSSGIGNAVPTHFATQTIESERPSLMNTDTVNEFRGRFVRFESGKTMTLNGQGTSGKWLYVYAIVRGNNGSIIFSNGTNDVELESTAQDIDNGWRLQKTKILSDSNSFIIGGDAIDVAEIIVYGFDGELDSTQESALDIEISEIIDEKFVPLSVSAPIDVLLPLSDVNVFLDDPYTAPTFIPALLLNGLNKYVPVTWPDNGVVDTSELATITITGQAVNDETKTATLKINVLSRPVDNVSVTPVSINMVVGDKQTPDETVDPPNATFKGVSWTVQSEVPKTIGPVVTVNEDTGEITAVNGGTAVVRVSSDYDSTKYADVSIQVESEIELRQSLQAALSELGRLTVQNATNRNNQTKPSISVVSKSGYTIIMDSKTVQSSAAIDISGSKLSATITRDTSWDRSGTITLKATKTGFMEDVIFEYKIFSVSIPRNRSGNSSGAVTVSPQ